MHELAVMHENMEGGLRCSIVKAALFYQQAHERWRNHADADGDGPSQVPFNGINVGFLDGSVRWRPAADTTPQYPRYNTANYRIVF